MSDVEKIAEIRPYILDSRYAVLNYVREDLSPIARTIGSFALDGDDLFFSTGKDAAKVREIGRHPRVSVHFEREGQELESWKSVLLVGDAEPVLPGAGDHERAVALLSARSPRFRARVESGDLAGIVIHRIIIREFQYLDFKRSPLPLQINVS
jgi:nitroimidazol reductase NimA-like FMN-containing flavoprotein (pyridoxamine 5'-phosphate oxidase superfamily)